MNILKKSFLLNLAIVIAICAIIYWLFFSSLGIITHHNEETSVPNIKGKVLTNVLAEIESQGFDIDVDSTYDPTKPPLTIMDLQPDGGSKVKNGRTLFLIVNKVSPPETPMPNLVNLSLRSATLLLESSKLVLAGTQTVPDMANGAVLKQLLNGQPVAQGQMIPQGSKITLVVGDGMGNTEVNVPNVVKKSYLEAINLISSRRLKYDVQFEGDITDTLSAIVIAQSPQADNGFGESSKISEGGHISIRVKQDNSATINNAIDSTNQQ